MTQHAITLQVNGREQHLTVRSHHTLLDILRQELGLLGAHEGCRMGDCGACTVMVDGRRVLACLILAPAMAGRSVRTIEGLGDPGRLHPMQRAFVDHGALQCGFCTPGMVLSAIALLTELPHRPLTETEVRDGLSGNLCRCTGYAKIVAAILEVANG